MDYQAADQVVENMEAADQVVENMEKESSSDETSDLIPTKPNKQFLELKFSKTLKSCSQQHICSVCSKVFASGKALGGHVRIHNNGSKRDRSHRKISKLQLRNIRRANFKKRNGAVGDLHLIGDQEGNEKVSCCICSKDFRSMKSLFGHMKNHPERGWRGIRPPPSDKTSCCSSVSENDEALEVDQISCAATEKSLVSGSDLLGSLPKWTNTAKRGGKFINPDHDNEISEAAYCLMKLARGDSFDLGESSGGYRRTYSPTDNVRIDQTRSWSLANKASETGQFQKFPMKRDQEEGDPSTMEGRYRSKIFPSSQTPGSNPKNPTGGLFEAPFNGTAASAPEGKTPTIFPTPATQEAESNQVCTPKMLDFNQFQKFPTKPDEGGDPLAIEGSQTPGSYPKNHRGGQSKAPLIETASSAAESSQVRTPKILDFDLNEPYVPLDGEDIGTWIN